MNRFRQAGVVLLAVAVLAIGSVLLAYDALGIPVSNEMYANLEKTAPGASFFSTAGAA